MGGNMLSYNNLQRKYGEVIAHSILMDIERHLRLDSASLAAIDPELRFQAAILMMEEVSLSTAA